MKEFLIVCICYNVWETCYPTIDRKDWFCPSLLVNDLFKLVLKLCFSVITFLLVDRLLLWSRPLHWYATLWPSNGRETFICVENLGEKLKKYGFNAGSAFPSCVTIFVVLQTLMVCYVVLPNNWEAVDKTSPNCIKNIKIRVRINNLIIVIFSCSLYFLENLLH